MLFSINVMRLKRKQLQYSTNTQTINKAVNSTEELKIINNFLSNVFHFSYPEILQQLGTGFHRCASTF